MESTTPQKATLNSLIVPTIRNTIIGAIVLGAILFIPSGTLNYWQGWLFIVVFSISTDAIGLYLARNDPALLERRKKIAPTSDQSPVQRIIISIALLSMLGMLVLCALDHRYGWSHVPVIVSLVGNALVALGLFENLLVFRENSFGGSSIQTFDNQKVITTGPYALVRHPMYVGVLIMVTGIPLALGSWWGLLILVITVPVLVLRILDEENLLKKDLPGYIEYTQKVHYRLVPYVW